MVAASCAPAGWVAAAPAAESGQGEEFSTDTRICARGPSYEHRCLDQFMRLDGF